MNNNKASFEERKRALRQDFEKYMDEYDKTEIIRQSITDVKKRAQTAKKRREQSPLKTYGGTKSKVSQNINTYNVSRKKL